MSIQPFEIFVSQATLDDLRARLAATRPVPEREATDWNAGTSPALSSTAGRALAHHYDWRAHEAELNRRAQFRARVGDTAFISSTSAAAAMRRCRCCSRTAFPDSFVRFAKLIPLLTDPAAHGGDAADAFDVVVPSLPGYGFLATAATTSTARTFQIGDLWHALMTDELGYEPLRRARRRLGQHRHRAPRAQPCRRPSSASTSRTSRSGMRSGARTISSPAEAGVPGGEPSSSRCAKAPTP